MRLLSVALAIVAVSSRSAVAEDLKLRFDPARTQIEFTLGDVLHTVHGTFKLQQGALQFNPATGLVAGQLVVAAASGESGSDARDSRMRKNILETQRYPEIVFAPDHFTGDLHLQGDSDVKIHGLFLIHGSSHELDLPANVHSTGEELTIDMQFPVPYVKWGMKNPSTLFLRVSDTVMIHVRAAGSVK